MINLDILREVLYADPADRKILDAAVAEIRADERAVIVSVLARMARDAASVQRLQRQAALTRAAEVIKSGVRS